jgi:hypothetical protein
MSDKYKKQDHHKTDKYGNIIPNYKIMARLDDLDIDFIEKNKPPINNPFKEVFGDLFPGFKDKK